MCTIYSVLSNQDCKYIQDNLHAAKKSINSFNGWRESHITYSDYKTSLEERRRRCRFLAAEMSSVKCLLIS